MLEAEIGRVHQENFGVYAADKVWRQLNRERVSVGRDRVARLMHDLDLTRVPALESAIRERVALLSERIQVQHIRGISVWSSMTGSRPR